MHWRPVALVSFTGRWLLWFLLAASAPRPGILLAQQAAVSAQPILPDPRLTPGDTLDVTLADIREKGYSSHVRNVPIGVKRQVYANYGISQPPPGEYEIDHLIPLSIGGSNSTRNLWPQSNKTSPWNARVKNWLERKLLSLVRSGKVDLKTAQQDIARNWIEAYKKYIGPEPRSAAAVMDRNNRENPPPEAVEASAQARRDGVDAAVDEQLDSSASDNSPGTALRPSTSSRPEPAANAANQLIWVNTKSGVIWKPGSAYYGKTKEGKYMSADKALRAGYHYVRGTGGN